MLGVRREVGLQQAEDQRPAAVALAQVLGDKAEVRKTHGGHAIVFLEIKAVG